MRFLFTCILGSFLLFNKVSANTNLAGAKQTAMGGYSATVSNVFSLYHNISNTAFLSKSAIGLNIDNRFFFAKLLNFQSAYIHKHKKFGSFSIGNTYIGYSSFYHHRLKLGYARSFGEKLALGLSLNHHLLSIKENGSKQAFSFDLGFTYKPINNILIGISIKNPVKQKIEKIYKETLESNFQLGIAYHAEDKFILGIQFIKDLKYPMQVQLGAEYQIHQILFFRAGAAINPTTFSAGLGIQLKRLQLDLASSWNIHLGISPQISLQYEFPSKKD